MKLTLPILAALACLLLNSCCSTCQQFWEQVDRGDFYDDALQNEVESILAQAAPASYKSVARVVLYRSGSEQAFSILANVDRSKNQLSIAGLADLGSVMFVITVDQGRVTLKKNISGWDDTVLTDMLAPLLGVVFLPAAPENAIIQNTAGQQFQHRSRRADSSIDAYVFDREHGRWVEYRLHAFSLFGEIERIQRVRFDDFRPVPQWAHAYPHRIDVDDAVHGFKATVSVRSLSVR